MSLFRQLLAVILLSGLFASAAQARGIVADSSKVGTPLVATRTAKAVAVASPVKTIKLSGKIVDGVRALPGAVVVLTATHQMTVTNAAGEFSFDVLPQAGPLQANISYAGYTEAEVTLSTKFNEATVALLKTRATGPARSGRHTK
ncbi:carboxypeptidase-like regulatory domain-containing protein [Hymenobacter properus]|uniref:Carboxypeptidase-like regulatory domain-containing protein n=1 Tax=Hymenobacter properus TaxID=2791026 RepID=A0A931FLE2_9BACT|nr:carboxypeptidase-like regulatory domain-containing protein [Hymenobacter properus]MBF9142755.1 carboxypeptidase-like regulatory domain-containing protein [Hymenobacter properus]MBR7721563.1 carboxypeptidase-like regulatory domain-containing protein [Microvirga sp. SRT04]